MEEHELTAWLGDTDATDEQRSALHRAVALVQARYSEDLQGEAQEAFSAAAQVILGDSILDEHMTTYTAARTAERAAMAALTGAIIAASADASEVHIAKQTGLNRMTVRKALGK